MGLTDLLFRQKPKMSDDSLVGLAENYETLATQPNQYWDDSRASFKEARKCYERMSGDNREHMLNHARLALCTQSRGMNSANLEAQFNYSKRIFAKYDSVDDLLAVAEAAELASFGMKTDVHTIQFMNYARKIYGSLEKTDEIKKLGDVATRYAQSAPNSLVRDRFQSFAKKCYRQAA